LILITLRDLVEEIRVYNDHLSDKRRRAMNVALTNALQDIMAFFKKFIEMQYQLFMQMRTLPHPLHLVSFHFIFAFRFTFRLGLKRFGLTGNEKHAHLVTAVLNTIAAYLEWTPIEYAPSFHFIIIIIIIICGYTHTLFLCGPAWCWPTTSPWCSAPCSKTPSFARYHSHHDASLS
jgi:hypothetical protein